MVGKKAKASVPANNKPPAPSSSKSQGSGGATIANEVMNLVKAIVGVGVLSLPAGIAAFGSTKDAVLPALLLITSIGILSAYGFALIGKVCAYTGSASYREAWSKSVGPRSSWIPAWSTTLKTLLACLAFSMVLADTFSALLGARHDQRAQVLVGLTTCLLLPLCWMKNLSSLAPFSMLGVVGMAYTGFAMTKRWTDGSYVPLETVVQVVSGGEGEGGGGKIVDTTKIVLPELLKQVDSKLRPSFDSVSDGSASGWQAVLQPNALILVCMLSTAYMAHFNAPKFYLELRNNTLPRFYGVVGLGFGLSILLTGFIASVGYLTFGKSCSGLILNNYASSDVLISASRVAVAVSLVFSYPLAFQGCRDGMLDLLQVKDKSNVAKQNVMTVALLAVLTALAATLKDVSFVLAFGGATLGNALTYLYPAIMYHAALKKKRASDKNAPGETFGLAVAWISALLGVGMGAVGAKMALEKI